MGELEQCPYTGNECHVQECDSCYTAREAIKEAMRTMTLNGAIMQLTVLWNHRMMPVQLKPALEKVIEALSELEERTPERTETHTCDCGRKETHGDVIYRADAMRILDEAWVDDTEYNGDLHTAFEELPSAEKQEKVIYSTMPDEDFEEWLRAHGICHPDIHEPIPCSVVPLLIDDAINELPSAESKRKTGKWIRHPEQANIYGGKCVECSECGEKYVVSYIEDEKFCRNCGARMEVQKCD